MITTTTHREDSMSKSTWAIAAGNSIAYTDLRFSLTLADNGELADARQTIAIAPSATEHGVALAYLTTNGDPVLLASLDAHSTISWYYGEDCEDEGAEDGETLQSILAEFAEFAGMGSAECAEHIATLFGAHYGA